MTSKAGLIVAVLIALAFAVACGWTADDQPGDSHPPSPREPDAERSLRGVAAPERKTGIAEAFERIREEHRGAEGRTGILAEERLYSHFDEELIIRDFFQDRRGGFYLDVGCADPVKGSNTYYLEKHLGWTGIGVDALVEYAAGWQELRPNSRFFSHLVSDRSGGQERFFKSFGRGLSSTNKEWARGKGFGVDFPTEEMQVETITLDDLLDREGVSKLDLLSMDIEGHEPKALAGFDIERFEPELVVVEGQQTDERERAIASYFERHGYERIEKYRPFDKVNGYYQRRASAGRE